MGGAPTKVVWAHEDDLRHGFGDRLASPQRGHEFHDQLRAGPEAARQHRVGHGPCGYGLQRAQHPHGGRQGAEPRTGGLVPLRVNNVVHAWSIQSFIAELAAQLGRDPKDFLLEMIGPPNIIDVAKSVTTPWWDYGEPAPTYPVDTGRLRRVGSAAEKAEWSSSFRRGRGWRRCAPQLRELHRYGGARRNERQGCDFDPQGRHYH